MNNIQAQSYQTSETIQAHENSIEGGTKTETMLTYNMVVGGAMNDLQSLRVDNVGRTINSGVHIQKSGLSSDERAVPHTEHVSVPSIHGDYNTFVSNKYNLLVGANGIDMKTLGKFDMVGGITSLMGREITISSDNNILIDGGKSLKLIADSIEIEGRSVEKASGSYKSIGINSNLGVNGNVTTKGGMHVEGQLSVHNITAPVEFQESEKTLNFGSLRGGMVIGMTSDGMVVTSVPAKDFSVSATSVVYPSIPTNFVDSNDMVRESASINNGEELVVAKPVMNGGNARTRPVWSFLRFLDPKLYSLFDDCRDESDAFDTLIDSFINGGIDRDTLQSSLTRASDSEISETRLDGDCKICD